MKRPVLFSERVGLTQRVLCSPGNPFPPELRKRLWDDYFKFVIRSNPDAGPFRNIAISLWTGLMEKSLDEFPSNVGLKAKDWIKNTLLHAPPEQAFNVLEFTLQQMPDESVPGSLKGVFITDVNETLSDFSCSYRILDDQLIPISDQEQLEEIDAALKVPLSPVQTHLGSALRALRDTSPDAARNSIRESIHAVEAICRLLTREPNETLGSALKKLKGKISIPEELEHSLHKLYGFTSNADGVRHAIFDEPNLTLREARFMVVVCSAFITYLWDIAAAAGLSVAE